GEVVGALEPAVRLLDRDFPQRHGADVDGRLLVDHHLDVLGQRRVVDEPPQHDVRVKQEPHQPIPKSSAIAALASRESQASVRMSWPRSRPRAVRCAFGASGTSLATGVPARLMMISSPRSTRSMSRDRWVLASWMLNCASTDTNNLLS